MTEAGFIPLFGASWRTIGKSFQIVCADGTAEQDEAESDEIIHEGVCEDEPEADSDTEASKTRAKKSYKQEERRMCDYITEALRELYPGSQKKDFPTKKNCETSFNVGDLRGGNCFENVDVLAIHWKDPHQYELIVVEAKQDFTAEAVFQALSYTRFADRVWVAVRIPRGVPDDSHIEWFMGTHLELFEYTVDMGLGILACRRTKGNGYAVTIQHYPKLQTPKKTCRENFEERYKEELYKAGIRRH